MKTDILIIYNNIFLIKLYTIFNFFFILYCIYLNLFTFKMKLHAFLFYRSSIRHDLPIFNVGSRKLTLIKFF